MLETIHCNPVPSLNPIWPFPGGPSLGLLLGGCGGLRRSFWLHDLVRDEILWVGLQRTVREQSTPSAGTIAPGCLRGLSSPSRFYIDPKSCRGQPINRCLSHTLTHTHTIYLSLVHKHIETL